MLKIFSFIKFPNPILFNTVLPKQAKMIIPIPQIYNKDMKVHIRTPMVNKIFFNKVMVKEEVVIMVQSVLESLFYFQELMPKLMTSKPFCVPQHFSLSCSHYCSFVTQFTKLNNITIREDVLWEIIL